MPEHTRPSTLPVQTRSMLRIFSLYVFIFSGAYAQQIDYKGFPQWKWGHRDSTEFYLYTPDGMESGKRYPVVLVLHGCCGEDNHATLRSTVDPLVRVWHNFGANKQSTPTYIVAPKTKRGWMQHAANLKAVLDDLIESGQGDPQRIYITGFSMGAAGTWQILEMYPGFFAAALPMGMDYTGANPEKIKHIPIWTFRGENDWWARHLGKQVADLRQRNGWPADSAEWNDAVNPRITTFDNMGHGIMWAAASHYDLPGWALSKINDGNIYPQARFTAPVFGKHAASGDRITFEVDAVDCDGVIDKVVFRHNNKLIKTRSAPPFRVTIQMRNGDNDVTATAFDDKGKTVTAKTMVRVNVTPSLIQSVLPDARRGKFYSYQLSAQGNGKITFRQEGDSTDTPPGLHLTSNGQIRGVPGAGGNYRFTIRIEDEYGDPRRVDVNLTVREKEPEDVVISEARTKNGIPLPITLSVPGEMPFFDRGDDEVTLSAIPERYLRLPMIQTPFRDSTDVGDDYLSFTVDEPVTVLVAYEKLDNLFTSTLPDWLSEFTKEADEQIVAQYYYYDIFARDFPRGTISLPGANASTTGVNTNYFVMIRSKSH